MGGERHPQWGVHMGLGNAQQGEVEWMRREGIPVYVYTVDEYAELAELAAKKEGVPSSRLWPAPEPELHESALLTTRESTRSARLAH